MLKSVTICNFSQWLEQNQNSSEKVKAPHTAAAIEYNQYMLNWYADLLIYMVIIT